jgi:hypothetical protein
MKRIITDNFSTVDCSSATSASTKIIYYITTGETPKNTFAPNQTVLYVWRQRCSRCDALIEESGEYNKFEISSSNTAASNNFKQVFFYCHDCIRWMKRKRWIRFSDSQKYYGSYNPGPELLRSKKDPG